MTNRKISEITHGQRLLALVGKTPVAEACRCIWETRKGSVLVIDEEHRLIGIFTGRDAVRVLADGKDPETTLLLDAMTPKPITITPKTRAIDALRKMHEHGFRHLPVVDDGKILGVVSRGDFKGLELDLLD
jgi:CBS domain-containing protein